MCPKVRAQIHKETLGMEMSGVSQGGLFRKLLEEIEMLKGICSEWWVCLTQPAGRRL